jgi:folylpolyglutamate synthase/dihydropteroate synthase
LAAAGVSVDQEHTLVLHRRAADALADARARASVDDRILVFGSFLTVADVIADRI